MHTGMQLKSAVSKSKYRAQDKKTNGVWKYQIAYNVKWRDLRRSRMHKIRSIYYFTRVKYRLSFSQPIGSLLYSLLMLPERFTST